MMDVDFIDDVRHTVAAAFNVVALLRSPETMRRVSAEGKTSELRVACRGILGDTIETLRDRRFHADPHAQALLEIFTPLSAALERWMEDTEPPPDVIEHARECERRLEGARRPHQWPASSLRSG